MKITGLPTILRLEILLFDWNFDTIPSKVTVAAHSERKQEITQPSRTHARLENFICRPFICPVVHTQIHNTLSVKAEGKLMHGTIY